MGIKLSDEALMVDFQQGNERAFEQLLRRHQHGVYNFIYRFFRNPQTSEEVFQEVFLKLHRAVANYSPTGKFTTWLYTIARNQCVDTYRRLKLRRALSLDSNAGGDGSEATLGDMLQGNEIPQDILSSARQLEDVLEMALGQLNEDQREVFLLREKKGFKFEEIAEITGVSVNTVKSRMRYALEGIKKIIQKSKYRELLEKG